MTMQVEITGASAAEIAESVRELRERGMLRPGDALPPVRTLAERLGVNRNTVMAAYRHLAQAGYVSSHGRSGTRIADPDPIAQEGYAPDTVLRDIGTGNPDPDRIPDPSNALARMAGRPVLYGEPVIDRDLERWALEWMRDAVDPALDLRLTVTSGASDAIERLLAQALTRDDAVALEDPCFLSSINIVRQGGYRAVAVPVDAEGMTVAGLQAAIDAGVRAVVCTPRAQNPTGASLSAQRARALRAVLAQHPYVLVIEDDHFSMLSSKPHHSIIGPAHRRFALVRSVSKFLGPDMCLAVVASDPATADRLAMRLSPGTVWVSHLLQRLTAALVGDDAVTRQIGEAAEHYAARNAAFAGLLTARGIPTEAGDGLSVWVPLPVAARDVLPHLMRRGWLVRPGDEFVLADDSAAHHLRVTVHELSDEEAGRLSDDISAAVAAVAGRGMIER
jgi:DNA-binding transcriptional MocR family regulator